MIKVILKVEKMDIVTTKLGNNIQVELSDTLSLIFTTEALEELIKDYESIKEKQNANLTKHLK